MAGPRGDGEPLRGGVPRGSEAERSGLVSACRDGPAAGGGNRARPAAARRARFLVGVLALFLSASPEGLPARAEPLLYLPVPDGEPVLWTSEHLRASRPELLALASYEKFRDRTVEAAMAEAVFEEAAALGLLDAPMVAREYRDFQAAHAAGDLPRARGGGPHRHHRRGVPRGARHRAPPRAEARRARAAAGRGRSGHRGGDRGRRGFRGSGGSLRVGEHAGPRARRQVRLDRAGQSVPVGTRLGTPRSLWAWRR